MLLTAKFTLPFLSIAFLLLFHEQDNILWKQNYSSVENLLCCSAQLTRCFTCVLLGIFGADSFALQPAAIEYEVWLSLCALGLLRPINPRDGLKSEGEDGFSQTPCNETVRPWPLLIHFPVFWLGVSMWLNHWTQQNCPAFHQPYCMKMSGDEKTERCVFLSFLLNRRWDSLLISVLPPFFLSFLLSFLPLHHLFSLTTPTWTH